MLFWFHTSSWLPLPPGLTLKCGLVSSWHLSFAQLQPEPWKCVVRSADTILSLRIFQKQQLFKTVEHVTTPARYVKKQQTVKWPKATESFAKRPFLSKLNGRVSKQWNLILKAWNDSLWNVFLEILVFLGRQKVLAARFHTNGRTEVCYHTCK